MNRFLRPNPLNIVLLALLSLFGTTPKAALAESPVKVTKLHGVVDLSADAPHPFDLEGIASHLGKFTAYGEIEFVPGEEQGSLLGTGVVVFEAANGDLLVGIVTQEVDPAVDGVGAAHIHFSWRDSVEFSDGRIISSTGRFVTDRPSGLVVLCVTIRIGPFEFVICGTPTSRG
jgi:hypothetical protein